MNNFRNILKQIDKIVENTTIEDVEKSMKNSENQGELKCERRKQYELI